MISSIASDENRNSGSGIDNSVCSMIHAFTHDGEVFRWYLHSWASIAVCASSGGRGMLGRCTAGRQNDGLTRGSTTGRGRKAEQNPVNRLLLAAAALPTTKMPRVRGSSGRGRGDRPHPVVFASDSGLSVMDAARGELLQEMVDEGGISHVTVAPKGKTIVSVSDVSILHSCLMWPCPVGNRIRSYVILPE